MTQQTELEYIRKGDYLFPNLTIAELPAEPLGKYGRMRKHYLKEHWRGLYQSMLLSGKLDAHLAEIDRAAMCRMDRIVQQRAEAEGVNETLKAVDQMAWVGRMENIRNRAEEIILAELIYNYNSRESKE